MTNLDSILKSRDITLPTKVCIANAMVFPVVMYGCERRTIKKVLPLLRLLFSIVEYPSTIYGLRKIKLFQCLQNISKKFLETNIHIELILPA